MKGESPYPPNELKYNCIFSTVVIAFSSGKLSLVYKATACPMKSTVLGSNENFII